MWLKVRSHKLYDRDPRDAGDSSLFSLSCEEKELMKAEIAVSYYRCSGFEITRGGRALEGCPAADSAGWSGVESCTLVLCPVQV